MYAETTPNTTYRPVFIPKEQYADTKGFDSLTDEYSHALVLDLFAAQFKELVKVRNPRERLSDQQLDEKYSEWISQRNADQEGCWVYYPWSNRLLHILDKQDFIELRTARNQHKITLQEQKSLSRRTIGIIGLSVGHAIALTLATERSAGSFRLADFDTLELSNLNRISTGIHNSGLNKSVITAREIAEIDPFLDIECFTDGITADNLHAFLTKNGKLDLLIDECDDIEIKIKCREAARPLGIPVIMETSDRGLLDVERFDREVGRTILHGLLDDIPAEKLKNITPADRVGLVMRISDVANVSPRGRASLIEVGQSISTWPQLASAVILGGGVVADVSRRILLDQFTESGRYYVDLEKLVGNKLTGVTENIESDVGKTFDLTNAISIVSSLPEHSVAARPGRDHIEQIVEAGSQAPSTGNTQPWKWLHKNGRLYLFHDESRSLPFFNYKNIAAHFALGAAWQNVLIKSAELGYRANAQVHLSVEPGLIATIDFSHQETGQTFPHSKFISTRATNKAAGITYLLTDAEIAYLQQAADETEAVSIEWFQDPEQISKLADIVSECELISILHEKGHTDFFEKTINWNPLTAGQNEAGIEPGIAAPDPISMTALSMLRDKKVAGLIKNINGGNLLAGQRSRTINASSCIVAVRATSPGHESFDAGRAVQDIWLRTTELGLSGEVLFSPTMLFERERNGEGLGASERERMQRLLPLFNNIAKIPAGSGPVFLLRIHKSSTIATKTNRLALDKVLFIVNDEI